MTYTIHSQARRQAAVRVARARAITLVLTGLITIGVLIAAIVQAVQGDWAPAIFLAVLWVGLKSTRADDE